MINIAMNAIAATIPDRIDETDSPVVLMELKVEVVPSKSGKSAFTSPTFVLTIATPS